MSDHLARLDLRFGPPAVMSLTGRGLVPDPPTVAPVANRPGPEWVDRVAGALVGAAIGSALGAPVEWWDPQRIHRRFGLLRDVVPARPGSPPGRWNADVQLLALSLEALLADPDQAPVVLARRLGEPGLQLRNAGNAVPAAIARLRQGVPWFEAGVASFGNGATVRALAAGLALPRDPVERTMAAALDTVVTHASADAVGAAVAVAHAVVALLDQPLGTPDLSSVLESVVPAVPDLAVAGAVSRVARVVPNGPDAVATLLPHGAQALDALPAALGHVLVHPDDPTRAVVGAVNAGGDTDTIGALTGALAGAAHGYGAFPARWVESLDGADDLVRLAERLTGATPSSPPTTRDRPTAVPGHAPAPRAAADAVHLSMLLDRSGSMSGLVSDVIGGVNAYLADQATLPGTCTVTTAQFDSVDPFEVLADDLDVHEVPELTSEVYHPRGCTPLYDAIGSLIDRADHRLGTRAAAGLPPDDQLVVIFTDGLENASHRWDRSAIFERIEARKAAGWTFVFLGANQDSYAEGEGLGLGAGSISNWEASERGVDLAFTSLRRASRSYRAKPLRERRAATDDFFEGVKEAEEPRRGKDGHS